jgi:hypothetical protein
LSRTADTTTEQLASANLTAQSGTLPFGTSGFVVARIHYAAVPEPSTLGMGGVRMVLVGGVILRKLRRSQGRCRLAN